MSVQQDEIEYAEMLVSGNASIFWHTVPKSPKPGEIDAHIKAAIYRAVRQALSDRAGVALPVDWEELERIVNE